MPRDPTLDALIKALDRASFLADVAAIDAITEAIISWTLEKHRKADATDATFNPDDTTRTVDL